MVRPILEILLGPLTLLWAISAAISGTASGALTLFTMALTGGFGTVMYVVTGRGIVGLMG